MAKQLAKGIEKHELCPEVHCDEGNFRMLGFYSKNRYEWAIGDISCVLNNIVSVPLYDTLGDNSVEFIVTQTELETIIMGKDKVDHICKLKTEGKLNSVLNIICFDELDEKTKSNCEEAGLKVFDFYYLISEGKDCKKKLRKPSKDSIFTICYTSGTTGDPKGVMSTHLNYTSTIGGLFKTGFNISDRDIHYSYLPLAHVFERAAHWAMLVCGARIGYYIGDVAKIKEDLAELKPTIFASVPRLLNRFYDLMQDGIKKQTGIKKSLLDKGIKSKLGSLHKSGSVSSGFYDALVFKKFKQVLGGRVKIIVTGSAPISGEVLSFLKIAFSCKVFEAYGQTETTAGFTITNPKDGTAGHVGGVMPHNELKLVDVPEMDYTSEDIVDGQKQPRGEICCRGNNTFVGYFKAPDKTQEAKDEEGWVHTGDIGQILPNGALRIIDRKKNIFKLCQGEYIAAEKLENIF
jgi:long-chain acyl-CoA synthetase